MSTTTQCPACGTRFKATQAQLEAYHGMVRCGHCHAAFDAIENRINPESEQQLNLPIVEEDFSATQPIAAVSSTPAPKVPASPAVPAPQAAPAPKPAPPQPAPTQSIAPEQVEEDEDEEHEDPQSAERKAAREKRAWVAAVVLLALLMFGQVVYLFRVDIAARLPVLKPTLLSACQTLRCEIPMPRNVDLVSIESSNLESDPAQPGVITLSVLARNLASYPQEYPNLELTLTDMRDVPLGRRLFTPAQYLKDAGDVLSGMPPRREVNINLVIDATTLKPVGYRVFLTYQTPPSH